MNEPTSLPAIENDQSKGLAELLKERRSADLMIDILAVLRARWDLRRVNVVGERVRVWGKLHVRNHGQIVIGSRVRFTSTITPTELVTFPGGRIEIGSNIAINYGCSIASTQLVRISDFCRIGTYVMIIDNSFHRLEPDRRHERPDPMPVIIEENVWLGGRVIVLPGVTIGRDSVVAAGSIVTRSIPPRSLAAGNPARVIRTL